MRRPQTHLLLTMLFIVIGSTALASTTWYVNGVSGSNLNNCKSSLTACKTIAHAISLASSGDSIRVAAGTYSENLKINITAKVIGSGASRTIIDGAGAGTVVTISKATAQVTLSNLAIRNGKATSGAGINNAGTLTLVNSTVSGNWAPIPCIYFLLVCGISRGTASGGGIYNSGALTISNSIISGNHAGSHCNASPCAAYGGGIYNSGKLMMIQNTTLTGNSAGNSCSTTVLCRVGVGGALYTIGGAVTLNNSTVTGNTAYRCSGVCNGTGGAIANGSGTLHMNNVTVSGNSAGGISNSSTTTLQNSIIANDSGTNCFGTATSYGYNLSSDNSCAFSNSGDRNHHDPMLGTLGIYGGPTPTIPLLTGSPAIDAGNPSGCTDGLGHLLKTDQRGMPRPDKEDSGGCDIGAFESQSD